MIAAIVASALSLIGLGLIAGYLAIGFHWSKKMLPTWWEKARAEWKIESNIRWAVREMYVSGIWFWPSRMISANADRLINQHDPERAERELKARDKRIKELERELGITAPEAKTTHQPTGWDRKAGRRFLAEINQWKKDH